MRLRQWLSRNVHVHRNYARRPPWPGEVGDVDVLLQSERGLKSDGTREHERISRRRRDRGNTSIRRYADDFLLNVSRRVHVPSEIEGQTVSREQVASGTRINAGCSRATIGIHRDLDERGLSAVQDIQNAVVERHAVCAGIKRMNTAGRGVGMGASSGSCTHSSVVPSLSTR